MIPKVQMGDPIQQNDRMVECMIQKSHKFGITMN